MIIKVIENTTGTSSVEQRVNGLSDYIHDPKPSRTDLLSDYIHQLHPSVDLSSIEKCVYSNARNFLDDDPQQQKLEMSQTASLNSKVIDPIVHIIGSFKKFEVPTIEQLEEQIDIISKHLKAKDLQMQYAVHLDTDNVHFHLIINKVHPFLKNKNGENKVIDLGEGWLYKSLQRAVAEIEAKQGWEPEPNSMYIYDLESKKCNENPNYIAQPNAEKVSSRIRDQEHRHQKKSDITAGIIHGQQNIQQVNSVIQHVLNSSDCWRTWHEKLASQGIYYEKKRNGAIFNVKFGQYHEQTFKASLFCNKATTLKNLEKKWGDFETSMMPVSNAIFRKKSATSTPYKFNDQHPYHLFERQDFLVQDLHEQYLKLKNKKDSITSLRKSTYKEVHFENEIYQNNKNQWLKSFKKTYPNQSTQSIFTLLHYQNQAEQTQLRKLQRENFSQSHEKLSQKVLQDTQAKFSLLQKFSSSKITSYADFLKYISPLHHLSIQQQFLLDQRQYRNFIRQDNPKIKTAKIIYDQHQPNEPIAIQNQYGILVFSNYSVPRLYQCIQHLDSNAKATPTGLPEFKKLYAVALQSFENDEKLVDINEKRVLPSLKKLSQSGLEACFNLIFKKFISESQNQSTALVKTSMLLNCCDIDLMKLQLTLKNCVDSNIISGFNEKSQKILIQRVNNLIQTQSTELNKQYFNSKEIEYCWKLYLNLESVLDASVSQQHPKMRPIYSSPGSDLRLIPKNETNKNYQRSESLSELDYLQIQQYFEYRQNSNLKKKKENKLSNTLDSQDPKITEDQNKKQKYFSHNKYAIEYKFGQKFYIDQRKVAFFERDNSPEIIVVSEQKKHIEDALLLALDKFGSVLVSGTDDFKRQVQEIAQLTKIEITFDIAPAEEKNHVNEEEFANKNVEIVDDSLDPIPATQIQENTSINDCNSNKNKHLFLVGDRDSSVEINDSSDFCL
ncbi:relaxase/mobilization nuclease domain-containing protein [Acinetobacter sp. YH12227]|uniref:relaxase/mobilization nuclease domain-containing protein n=1 Tax=Acinetobacter sp. YH12227 TaxID=2601158 RepID=UPI0015D3E830|nr:relaxase/mobilization nuclease domain-containing protein [Acinetobacter sp. YH12227]